MILAEHLETWGWGVRLDHHWFAKTRSFARAGLRNDGPVYLAALTYVLICMAYIFARGSFEPAQFWATAIVYAQVWWQQYGLFFPLILAGIGWAHITLRLSQRRRLAYRIMFGPERIGRLLAGIVLLSVMVPFHTAFNAVKTLVPLDQGFAFDRFFADLDKTLFFGADPFALLYAAGKPEWLLRALELNYSNFWFVICFGMVYWVAVSPRLDGIRVRYFVSFLLTWAIVGNVLATIFSSAGPVYYGHVTGDYARFADQVAFLATTADEVGSAARYQTYLWEMYVVGQSRAGNRHLRLPEHAPRTDHDERPVPARAQARVDAVGVALHRDPPRQLGLSRLALCGGRDRLDRPCRRHLLGRPKSDEREMDLAPGQDDVGRRRRRQPPRLRRSS